MYLSKRWNVHLKVNLSSHIERCNGFRVHTHVYIYKCYLHDNSPNNPNVTKKHDLLVPLHFSFILSCLLSEELERVNSENCGAHEIKVRIRALSVCFFLSFFFEGIFLETCTRRIEHYYMGGKRNYCRVERCWRQTYVC